MVVLHLEITDFTNTQVIKMGDYLCDISILIWFNSAASLHQPVSSFDDDQIHGRIYGSHISMR